MSLQARKYQTQWASQFYVTAELTRRGYLVSLTLGNAPVADLLLVSPNQSQFMVDVKGQSPRNFWLVQTRENRDDLYFVLVYLPKDNQHPHYFILSCAEMLAKRDEYRKHIESRSGKYRDNLGGMNWGTAMANEDCWDTLPK